MAEFSPGWGRVELGITEEKPHLEGVQLPTGTRLTVIEAVPRLQVAYDGRLTAETGGAGVPSRAVELKLVAAA
jgi:hypothetical protein